MTDTRDRVSQWERALEPGADCLSIERFTEELSSAEREHVALCPRCAAEQRLFEAYERPTTPQEAAVVSHISSELARRAVASTPRTHAVTEGSTATFWRWAAVLLVAGGAAYAVWGWQPALRDPAGADLVYRSAAMELVAPTGDVSELPADFVWVPVSGAVRYDVTVREVDGSVLWFEPSTDSRLGIPPAVRQKLVPGKTVTWDVVAKGQDGREVARSSAGRLRVVGRSPSAGE